MFFEGKGVTIRFGGLVANSEVNMTVEQGEIVGLIGPNGAGKSTFFKSIVGINKPQEGTLKFQGTELIGKSTWDICNLGISTTFQLAKTFPALTVLETVMVGAHCRYNSTKEAKEQALKVMDFMGITQYAGYRNNRLDLFTRKKVEISAVLATDPKLLLLDEIFAGCTLGEDEELVKLVKRINQELGITILLVEHVLKVVHALCQRIYVLEHGKIIASGTPSEVMQNELVINAYLGKEDDEDAAN
jgi:branched-chain amino acid transport system ATP-binding protein